MLVIQLVLLGTLALSAILQALGTRTPERMRRFWIGLLVFEYVVIWMADWDALLLADYFISGPVTFAMMLLLFAWVQFWLMKPPRTLVARQYPFSGIIMFLVQCYVLLAALTFGGLALRFLPLPSERLDIPLMICFNVSLFCWMAMQCGMHAAGRLFSKKWSRDQKLLFYLEPQGNVSNYEEQKGDAISR